MLGPHKIVIDTWAEVYDILKPYADDEFWQFDSVEFNPGCTYILGRLQIKQHHARVLELADRYPGQIVFCNPAEGSETILLQLRRLRILDYVKSGKIKLITSGSADLGLAALYIDCYFTNIVDYQENIHAAEFSDQVYTAPKVGDFLFFNGRLRPHRKYLIDVLRQRSLLDRAVWTCLQTTVDMPWSSSLPVRPDATETLRFLPPKYEIERAVPRITQTPPDRDVKHWLFADTWGDAIVNYRPYIDTCFSVVTETIFDYPVTFRTEKIWKPILMAHPWIAVANAGYYRSMRNAGFKTFDTLIDETFDDIMDPVERMERIVDVIEFIIANDSRSFLTAAEHICKYNQQHLRQYNTSQRSLLPSQLQRYIDERS